MLHSESLLLLLMAMSIGVEGHILPRAGLVRKASVAMAPVAANLPAQRNITFPPEHCQLDEDCIGQNTTSRLYYDPNGRCDQKRSVCICLEGFKRLEFRVKPKRSYKLAQVAAYSIAGDHQPSEGIKYITKCVAEDEFLAGYSETSASSNGDGSSSMPSATDDLNLFLRSLQYYGQTCDEDKQCTANLICRQLMRVNLTSDISSNGNGSNPISRLLVNRVKRCRCPLAMHFNKLTRRCEFPYSNTYNGLLPGYRREDGRVNGNGALPNSGLLGLGSFPSSVQIHSSSIDWKIFEIVLELAFLIGCLLGYKACSRMCCREDMSNDTNSLTYGYTTSPTKSIGPIDEDDDQSTCGSSSTSSHSDPTNTCDLKSDEESIIGHSSPIRKPTTPIKITMTPVAGRRKVSPRVTRKRKVSRFYSRARRCTSPYNLQASIFGGDSSVAGGSSSSTSGGRGPNFRRLSSVSATMSRSSSASTRNLLVKVNQDDIKRLSVSTTLAPNYSPTHTPTPCYTCRIYQEVYSPSARCKSCRSSLLSIEDNELRSGSRANSFMEQFDSFLTLGQGESVSTADLSSMVSPYGSEKARGACGNNLHMPQLPPRHKRIRRSEEVGVPPHLRAPYRDTTPFWLK